VSSLRKEGGWVEAYPWYFDYEDCSLGKDFILSDVARVGNLTWKPFLASPVTDYWSQGSEKLRNTVNTFSL